MTTKSEAVFAAFLEANKNLPITVYTLNGKCLKGVLMDFSDDGLLLTNDVKGGSSERSYIMMHNVSTISSGTRALKKGA